MDRVLALHAGSRGFDSHRGHMSERFFRSNRPGYPHPVSSELEISGIRVAVGDCSVTERGRWRPPYQTGKTVHVHANTTNTRTAPGVCGNGSVPLSHSGNVVTRIGIHIHTHISFIFEYHMPKTKKKQDIYFDFKYNCCKIPTRRWNPRTEDTTYRPGYPSGGYYAQVAVSPGDHPLREIEDQVSFIPSGGYYVQVAVSPGDHPLRQIEHQR